MRRSKDDFGHYFPERLIREAARQDALFELAGETLRPMEEAIVQATERAIHSALLQARDTVFTDRAEFEKFESRLPTESSLTSDLAPHYTSFSNALAAASHKLLRDL